MALIFQLAHELSHHFSVSFASESYIAQVFIFDLGMVIDDSIVDDENFLVLVVVRVAISLVYLTTSGPSRVGDSNCRFDRFFSELVHESLNAI